MENTVFTTKSGEQTQEIGKKIAQNFLGGGVICLYGDLGSGKTTFTQGFAQGLGIERRVNSPTFIIMRTYQLDNALLFERERELMRGNFSLHSKNKRFFYHMDLYRISSEKDVEGLGVREILETPENIIVIEWAEKIEDILPLDRTDIYFSYLTDSERRIEIKHD